MIVTLETIAPMRDGSIYLMTGSHLGYDCPGSGMYNFYAKFLPSGKFN